MSARNLADEEVDSDEEEDEDYCPTKNENDQHSDASEESEHDEDVLVNKPVDETKQTDLNVQAYDESKTNELWKTFSSSSSSTPKAAAATTESPKPITKTFDYAGEKVSVPVPATTSLKRPAASSSSNAILDRLGIGKKQKLSTLEKSRLDWSVHKESEALDDDLDSHRRGKDSYVEKKAFLQRSEFREHDHYLTSVKKK